jgi:hypothetical protein
MSSDAASPDTGHPLSDHVYDYLESHKGEVTLRALEDRCVDPESGQKINRTYLSELARARTRKIPELWRLRALSAGLGTPLEALQRLTAEQWAGLPAQPEGTQLEVAEGDFVMVAVPAGLSERDRAKVVRWAENFARELDED